MTAKPICVVYLPENIHVGGVRIDWSDCSKFQDTFKKDKPGYYWFVLIDKSAERIELKVFYEKDFEEIKYEKLKKLITEKVNHDSKPNII